MALNGSCLCGGVRYQIDGALGRVVSCHCSMCRKATGAAFRTRASVAAAEFRWLEGERLVSRFASSPGEERTFCRVCGSTLPTFFRNRPGEIGLPLGTLDDDPGVRPSAHVWVDSKAPWYDITDELPRYAEGIPPASALPFHLRPSEPEDEAFLWRLNQLAYEDVVTAQFGEWEPVKQRGLFDAKWRLQEYRVIVSHGTPVGAVSSVSTDAALTLLELLVLPAHQNGGIGTRVVRELQAEARGKRLPLLLRVLHLNRARALYERLGFSVYDKTETHYLMRWDANVGSSSSAGG